ncbi:hypothetical protein EMCRGX_G030851 [Ephydatia muelleri]
MLPSVLSNLIWGYPAAESREEPTDHITVEAEDWLLVQRSDKAQVCEGGSAPLDHGSQVTSDNESVCSDASWVVAPAPRFRDSPETTNAGHPLENLLIEHPAMSVYGQIQVGSDTIVPTADVQLVTTVSEQAGQAPNRQRRQVALHMDVPPKMPIAATQRVQFKHPKLSRASITRHNATVTKTRVPRMRTRMSNSKKAGRRGC